MSGLWAWSPVAGGHEAAGAVAGGVGGSSWPHLNTNLYPPLNGGAAPLLWGAATEIARLVPWLPGRNSSLCPWLRKEPDKTRRMWWWPRWYHSPRRPSPATPRRRPSPAPPPSRRNLGVLPCRQAWNRPVSPGLPHFGPFAPFSTRYVNQRQKLVPTGGCTSPLTTLYYLCIPSMTGGQHPTRPEDQPHR